MNTVRRTDLELTLALIGCVIWILWVWLPLATHSLT